MSYLLDRPWMLFLVLFVFLMVVVRVGYRFGARSGWHKDDELHAQVKGTRDTLGLMLSLLLGFTLAMAVPRFDLRRHIIVDEANAIGTTYLRAKALPEPQSSHLQEGLRKYTASRVEFFEAGLDRGRMAAATAQTKQLQTELWNESSALARTSPNPIIAIFLTSLNEAIDLEAKRMAGLENRIPRTIWMMIIAISTLTMLSTGVAMRRRFWYSLALMPLTIAIVVGLIADLDSSRGGGIRAKQESMLRLQADINADKPGH